jgi:ligand-binding sensor domain-containing protein/signal transduction histidine kinase
MKKAILVIAFLMEVARGASSQLLPRARIDPRPIRPRISLSPTVAAKRYESSSAPVTPAASWQQLPIIDGADIRFARISTADGLSQTKVDRIVQDDQGFMWFGTQYGLNRYDGYNFKVFAHDPGDPNSLSGVYIRALLKDRDGTLWVGCNQFLNKFDPKTETFTRYSVPLVNQISQDSAGMLWLATNTGLYALDRSTGRIRRYSHAPNDPSSISSNVTTMSGEDKAGRFWVANNRGLDEFDRGAGKVILHIPLAEHPGNFLFYEDRFGTFWMFNVSGNPLAVLDRKTNTLTYYSLHDRDLPSTAFAIRAAVEDHEGALWLATQDAGLLKFDRDHRRFVRYHKNPADAQSLPEDSVIGLFADREGSIWAGLGRMGLTRFDSKPLPFKRVTYNPSYPSDRVEPFVGAIYEDSQRILWIGTPAVLMRIDRKAGQYTSYRTSGPKANSDVITICEDHSGNLWVGTYGHGLHRLNPRTGQFKTYRHNPADPYSLSNDIVSRLLVDHNGTLWAGTQDALDRFDAATERFTTYKFESYEELDYVELAEDRDGSLWLGTDTAGLRHFDPATGRVTMYQHDIDRPGTLSNDRVNSVHFDAAGTMWLGTQNGLDKFDPKTNSFTVYTRRDGLPGNAVGCILEDNHGEQWMSTNNGVARFDPQNRTFKNYWMTDGLPGPDLTGWGACFKSSSGEMFFGGFSGATAFFPDKVTSASYTPPIVLTDIRLPGNSADRGSHFSLQRSISYTRDLVLSHKEAVFSLDFAALSYSSPATNRYRYKLEGLEPNWNEVGSDHRQATYTTLPAGKYTFRVQGATSGGAWSEPGVAVRIEILPPWWNTWWFRTSYLAAFLVLLWALYRYRLHQIAQEFNVRLEERVNERTRIARELHDTLLQSFHGLLFRFQAARNLFPRRPEEAMQALDGAISRAEEAIAEGRAAIQDLRAEPPAARDLAHLLTMMGQELEGSHDANHNSASFSLTVEGKREALSPILQDEVYRVARELLRNAFQHAQARRIEAEIRYDYAQLRLRIRDDGKGIDPKVLRDGGRAGHWGLPGIRERAKRVGARLDFWSEADAGTEVELTVPASLAYAKASNGSRSDSGEFRLFRRKTGTHAN